MTEAGKQISNPFSMGGGGVDFEGDVQASFAVLMLAGGCVPCLPGMQIEKIKLQAKHAGFCTDDLVVFAQDPSGARQRKMLGQVKHSIAITQNSPLFKEVIHAAWSDFGNAELFDRGRGRDIIALITGPLSITDTANVRPILEWAREMESADEFLTRVELANFSSKAKRDKLRAFREAVKSANGGVDPGDDEFVEFLKHFHMLGYDLDIRGGVNVALLQSLIGQFSPDDVQGIWSQLACEVRKVNKNAGTISRASLPEDLQEAFIRPDVQTIPPGLAKPATPAAVAGGSPGEATALAAAALIGKWDEKNENDLEILRRLVDGF